MAEPQVSKVLITPLRPLSLLKQPIWAPKRFATERSPVPRTALLRASARLYHSMKTDPETSYQPSHTQSRGISSDADQQKPFECEVKFGCFPDTLKRLQDGQIDGIKPSEEPDTIRDEYFDTEHNDLTEKGLYLRRRDGNLQLKIRVSGDFVNSQFHEVDSYPLITRIVETAAPGVKLESSKGTVGLRRTAVFSTMRYEFKEKSGIKITIDETDFGHCVGEAEVCVKNEEEMKGVSERIRAFLGGEPGLFDMRDPVGKLTAYWTRFPWARGT